MEPMDESFEVIPPSPQQHFFSSIGQSALSILETSARSIAPPSEAMNTAASARPRRNKIACIPPPSSIGGGGGRRLSVTIPGSKPLIGESDVVASIVAHCLEQLTADPVPATGMPAPLFECPPGTVPSLTVSKYVARIAAKTFASAEALVLALILIDRLIESGLRPNLSSVYRIYATCTVLAIKLQDDRYYTNKFYARIAGVTLEELNMLERAILDMLGFDLYVAQEQWAMYAAPVDLLLQSAIEAEQQQQRQGQFPAGLSVCQSLPATPTTTPGSTPEMPRRMITNIAAVVADHRLMTLRLMR